MSGVSVGYDYLKAKARNGGYVAPEDTPEVVFDDLPLEMQGGTPRNVKNAKSAHPKKRVTYLLLSDVAELRDPHDFIEGLLCDAQISLVYGDTNVSKSFLALNLGLHVAQGRPCFDRETDKGAVVFLAGEGAGGLKRRIAA